MEIYAIPLKRRLFSLFAGRENSLTDERHLSFDDLPKISPIKDGGKISGLGKASLLIVILLSFISLGKSQPILINDSLAMIVSDALTPQTLDLHSLAFSKSPERRINIGLTGNEYHLILLKLIAENDLPGAFLSIDNTSLDTVMIYRVGNGKPASILYIGGRLIPYQKSRNFVWHTVYLDLKAGTSMFLIAIKSAHKNINIGYELLNWNILLKKYEDYNRIVFIYIGITFMISSITLLAFLIFKEKVFAIYFGYMLCISFWIIDHYGIAYPALFPNLPQLNKIAKPMSSLGAAFLLLSTQRLIFMKYLRLNKRLLRLINYLKTYLIIVLGAILFLLIPALSSFLITAIILLWHAGIILCIGMVAFVPLYFLRTSKVARIFSLAMLAICLTTVEQLLANAGLIKDYFLNEHGMALGSLMENSLMAFGLLYGLVMERREKNLLVIALQNDQQMMLKKLISVQYDERKRIAADLHDNIGPLLAALKINFRRIIQKASGNLQPELIEKTESIIDDSISEIRNIAHNLMPKELSSKGLILTLQDYFENVQQLYGKRLLFRHEGEAVCKPEIQINIYFILTELVLNAAKHSNAHLIKVFVKTETDKIELKILDDGQGFHSPPGSVTSLGLQSAQSRTSFLKGKFSLISHNGNGTLVNISIPL